MSKDYIQAFSKLMSSNFTRYRGCLIRHDGEKYSWGDKIFDKLELAKEEIDRTFPLLGNTIKK